MSNITKQMNDDPKWGFVPSPSSPKKRQLPTPNPEPKVVNNFFAVLVDPQGVLIMVILIIVMIAAFRFLPTLRA